MAGGAVEAGGAVVRGTVVGGLVVAGVEVEGGAVTVVVVARVVGAVVPRGAADGCEADKALGEPHDAARATTARPQRAAIRACALVVGSVPPRSLDRSARLVRACRRRSHRIMIRPIFL